MSKADKIKLIVAVIALLGAGGLIYFTMFYESTPATPLQAETPPAPATEPAGKDGPPPAGNRRLAPGVSPSTGG